jgi:cobalamin biosynthesis protein CobW
VTVDGVVTVVDGPAAAEGRFAADEAAVAAQRAADPQIDHETPIAELFEDQLACADMVVVSKSDLMDGAALDRVLAQVAPRAREGVRLVPSRAEGLAPEVLLGLRLAAEDDVAARAAPHHDAEGENHDHDEFESFAVRLGEVADVDAFAERLAELIRRHDVLRLKGFAAVAGRPMRLVVQAVGPRVECHYDRPFGAEPRQTRLVVIGEAGLDRAAIEAALGA